MAGGLQKCASNQSKTHALFIVLVRSYNTLKQSAIMDKFL